MFVRFLELGNFHSKEVVTAMSKTCWVLKLVLIGLVSCSVVSAGTLTVHSNGTSGDYTTITAALTAANPGDVIEILEECGYFVEKLLIDKADITIRGQQFAPSTLFFAGSFAWPGDNVITVAQNAGNGFVLENMNVCAGTGVFMGIRIFDGHVGTGITFRNCYIASPPRGDGDDNWDAALHIYGNNKVTVDGCEIFDGKQVVNIWDVNAITGPVDVTITDTKITTYRVGNCIQMIEGGNLTIDKCDLTSMAGANRHIILRSGERGTPTNFSMTNSLIGASPFSGIGSSDGLIIAWSGGGTDIGHTILIDNCDFLGGWTGGSTHNAIILGDSVASLTVTDNIFSGFNRFWYLGGAALTNPGPLAVGVEDFNVYAPAGLTGEISNNDLFDQHGFPEGANTLELSSSDHLYIDRANGGIHLLSTSPAATHNSTGSPAYCGSRGLADADGTATVHSDGITGEYTSVELALSGIPVGGTIQILDNTKPFLGNLTINKKVTIEGAPGLDPRPVIQGTFAKDSFGVGGEVIFLKRSAANNSTFRNLIIDGRNNSIVASGWYGGEGSTYDNCRIYGPVQNGGVGPFTHSQTFNSGYPMTVRGCEIIGGQKGFVTEGSGVAGSILLEGCTLREARTSAVFCDPWVQREVVLNDCDISHLSGDRPIVVSSVTATITMNNSIVRPDPNTGVGSVDGLVLFAGGSNSTFHADNCDFIGSLVSTAGAGTHNAFVFVDSMLDVQVTDSILTNFSRYWWVSNSASGNQTFFDGVEDYNVYGSTLANDIATADQTVPGNSYPAGTHDLQLSGADHLYLFAGANGVGAILSDFKLFPDSPAATTARSSTGGQSYAGSQGLMQEPSTSVDNWAIFQ
jgi:hypothetical protein